MKKGFRPETTFHKTVALSFVIPSEAEGSAVLRDPSWICFLTERQRRVPHISLVFREMWDTTAPSLNPVGCSAVTQNPTTA
jgi:hypothetical protein